MKLFFLCVIVFSKSLDESLSKDETGRDSSLTLLICPYTVIKTMFMYFCVWFSWP